MVRVPKAGGDKIRGDHRREDKGQAPFGDHAGDAYEEHKSKKEDRWG